MILTTVARVHEHKRIAGSHPRHQPFHGSVNVCPRRLLERILLVLVQHQNLLLSVKPEALGEAVIHIASIRNAPSQLLRGPSIIDPDEEGLAPRGVRSAHRPLQLLLLLLLLLLLPSPGREQKGDEVFSRGGRQVTPEPPQLGQPPQLPIREGDHQIRVLQRTKQVSVTAPCHEHTPHPLCSRALSYPVAPSSRRPLPA